jgi:hypothetical protein
MLCTARVDSFAAAALLHGAPAMLFFFGMLSLLLRLSLCCCVYSVAAVVTGVQLLRDVLVGVYLCGSGWLVWSFFLQPAVLLIDSQVSPCCCTRIVCDCYVTYALQRWLCAANDDLF